MTLSPRQHRQQIASVVNALRVSALFVAFLAALCLACGGCTRTFEATSVTWHQNGDVTQSEYHYRNTGFNTEVEDLELRLPDKGVEVRVKKINSEASAAEAAAMAGLEAAKLANKVIK